MVNAKPGQVAYIAALAARLGYEYHAEPHGTVSARYEGRRLLADCPYCTGAELVDKDDRLFFCFSCGMTANGGQPMTAWLPDGA